MTGSYIGFSGNYGNFHNYRYTFGKAEEASFAGQNKEIESGAKEQKSQRGSIMNECFRDDPANRAVQEGRIKEGYAYLATSGLSPERLENMPMTEFTDAMKRTVSTIPFHSSRPHDEETVVISEDGWNNMKKDPDYAAWIVGYLKEDRQVANKFSEKGDKGTFCVQEFGATPADYHGHSYSKIFGGTAAGARTMYLAESGSNGIATRARFADEEPSKNYNLWDAMRRSGRRKFEEITEAGLQARTQQNKSIVEL